MAIHGTLVICCRQKLNSQFVIMFRVIPCVRHYPCWKAKELFTESMVQEHTFKKKNFVAHIDHMNSFSEIAHKSGKEAGSQIMKFEVQDASPTIATELNLVPGEQVYYIKRLRFIEDNAAQLEETWMSVARFPDLTVSHMQKSKFSYIENECGIKIIGTYETFSPTFPTPEIASILRISPRDPILKIQTQAVDSNSIPLDYSLLYSNIIEFQVKYFFRDKSRRTEC